MSVYFQKTYQRSFGTYPLKGEEAMGAIQAAVEVGYRSFDTAQMYENEADVGEALANASVARDELLVTTKVHPANFDAASFLPSVEESLKKLRLDVVDVLLLHWPPADGAIETSVKLLAEAQKKGLAKNIGVSNYTIQMMRDAQAMIDVPICSNQVEFHPLLDQEKLLAGANDVGVPLASYCSVARGKIFERPEFAEIGATYEKSAAQVALRWILQKGVSLNTMSTKPKNIQANFDIMDFSLSSVDMAKIDHVAKTNYRIVDSSLVPWAPVWD